MNVNLDSTTPSIAQLDNPEWRIDTSKLYFDYSATTIGSIQDAMTFIKLMERMETDSEKEIYYSPLGRSVELGPVDIQPAAHLIVLPISMDTVGA